MVRKLLALVLISFNIIVMVNCVPPTCYQCDSEVDDDCKIITVASSQHLKSCEAEDTTGGDVCYTLIDGNNVERNCLLDHISPTFITECANNPTICYMCDEDECNINNYEPLQCIECNSDTDPDCVTLKTMPTPATQCTDASEQCYVGINNGHTERGCIAEAVCNAYPDSLCTSCTKSDNCNNDIYPNGRLKCLQCDSETEENCALTPGTLLATNSATCQIYDVDDSCFTIINEDRKVTRGCISDESDLDVDDCDNNEFCDHCDMDDCNKDHPIEPLKCFRCDSDADYTCAALEFFARLPEPCDDYKHKCFDGIDSLEVTLRGCTDVDECTLIPEGEQIGECEICSNENGCNNRVYAIRNRKCLKCKSSIDSKCLTNPTALLASHLETCRVPDDICFTLATDNREVIRGCISDDDPETPELSECNNANCITCDEDECNEHVLKVPLECIRCESATDRNCVTLEESNLATEICTDADEECFVGISTNGETIRGCITEAQCEAFPNSLCTSCSDSDNCNNQIFPSNRLKCLQCDSEIDEECASSPDALLRSHSATCQHFDENDSCFTIINEDRKVTRGCISDESDLDVDDCDNNEFCDHCDTDDCNKVPIEPLKCFRCDSDADYSCATLEFFARLPEPCDDYKHKCFDGIDSLEVTIRGCTDVDECTLIPQGEQIGECEICSNENGCNKRDYITKNLRKCLKCSSANDSNCRANPQAFHSETCRIPDDTCFTIVTEDRKVIRGCFLDGDPETPEISECDNTNCIACSTDECNVHIPQSCITCESGINPNCTTLEPAHSIVVPCVNFDEQCFVGVSTTGETIRGCITDTEFETYPNGNAERCSHRDACNENIFPEGRLKCLKCESTDPTCSSPATVETHSAICQNYRVDDSCFTIVTGNTNSVTVARGCISDEDAETKCSDSDTCVQCDSENCNMLKLKSEPSLLCIQCDQDDPKCEWGFAKDDAVPCTTADYLEGQELCYTYQNEDEIKRGCVLDDNTCMEEDESCDICSGDGCNNIRIAESKCFICDTENTDEAFCGSAITGEDFEVCSDGNSAYGYRGCYTEKIDERVHRGCVSTLTNEELLNCENAANLDCAICYDIGCNNGEPNFASRLYYLSTLTLIFISLLAKLLNSNEN